MVKAPTGYMRRPAVPGFMAPQVVLNLIAVVLARLGQAAVDLLRHEAEVTRLPAVTEPVREDIAARLHQSVRRLWPDQAAVLLREAGRATADALLDTQQSVRAQAMLTGAPWPIAAWLLGRWARQHDWTFVGSGTFNPLNALEWDIADNPLIRGERAATVSCSWHMGLFERLFQRLVSPDLECREMACAAIGAPACRFVIARA